MTGLPTFASALVNFDKPVLLLWGEDDLVTPVTFAHRLVNELKNATLTTYPRCGHIPMVEARSRSTRDLVAFLAEASDESGSVRLVWFNQPYREQALKKNQLYYISGIFELKAQRFAAERRGCGTSTFPAHALRAFAGKKIAGFVTN